MPEIPSTELSPEQQNHLSIIQAIGKQLNPALFSDERKAKIFEDLQKTIPQKTKTDGDPEKKSRF